MKSVSLNFKKINNIKGILIGLFVSEIILTVLLSIMAIVMSSTGILNNTVLEIALTVICGIATFFAGFICSKISREKGLVNGLICGGIFFIVLLFTGMIMMDNTFSTFTAVKLTACLLFGAFGGLLGLNKKEKLIK